MFTKENIQFESEILIVGDESTKEATKSKLVCLVNQMIEQLKLDSLERVIIKPQSLFDSSYGTAYADKTIRLSYPVAAILTKGPDSGHSDKYKDALATLYHEGYHISDYQKVRRRLENPSSSALIGYGIWTEFFAVYATHCICEQEYQYSSFESVFSKYPKSEEKCRYYTSHLMGYFLHNEHSSECERLANQFLNTKHIEVTKQHLRRMLERYPNITINDLQTLKELFDKLLCDKIDIGDIKELGQGELLEWIRNKSRI